MTVTATFDHRPARVPQVPVQPLFPQHSDECGEQRDQKTRIHETGDGDDVARRIFPNRWNGRNLAGDGGLIKSEEDGAEESGGLFIRIRLEVGIYVDDKRRADSRKQTRLGEQVK